MSSSLRVLRQPAMDGTDGAGPAASMSMPSIEEAEAAAHRRGVEEGRAQAADQMVAAAEAVRSAIGAEQQRLRAEFDRQKEAFIEVAVRMAEVILGHAEHDGGAILGERLTRVLQRLDDSRLTVSVNPTDAEFIFGLGLSDIDVVSDASLRPGEARVVGDWSKTDLTFEAALAAARGELAGA